MLPHYAKVVTNSQQFLLYTDHEGTQPLTPDLVRQVFLQNPNASGLLRAVPTKLMGSVGEANLLEDQNALWFSDHCDSRGNMNLRNGGAEISFVRYLLEQKLISIVDRRQIIPIATTSGVLDTLVGFAGISIDLGRWKMLRGDNPYTDPTARVMRIQLGEKHTVFAGDIADFADTNTRDTTTSLVTIDFSNHEIIDGVGQIAARFFTSAVDAKSFEETTFSGTGAIAAAIAARHFGDQKMPHHWRVSTHAGPVAVRMFATEEGEHVSLNANAQMQE